MTLRAGTATGRSVNDAEAVTSIPVSPGRSCARGRPITVAAALAVITKANGLAGAPGRSANVVDAEARPAFAASVARSSEAIAMPAAVGKRETEIAPAVPQTPDGCPFSPRGASSTTIRPVTADAGSEESESPARAPYTVG